MIRLNGIGLKYGAGNEVLRDVTFHLRPGSFHFLTGPSGSGKTSLLRLLFMSLQADARADLRAGAGYQPRRRRPSAPSCAGASASCSRISGCSIT